MPNGKTQNYQLSQWEKTDQVRMEDFNADNRNIENALTGLETSKAEVTAVEELKSEVAQKAEQTALTALTGRVDGLASGKADAAKLTALESQVNGLSAGKADAAKLTALESQVNGLSTSKADASALTAEVNARTTADQSLTAALEKKADASALTALQSQVTGLASSKADATALAEVRNTLTGKGNCLIEMGSYIGSGERYGTVSITTSFPPKALFVIGAMFGVAVRAGERMWFIGTVQRSAAVTWRNDGLSWKNSSSNMYAEDFLNTADTTYHYVAIG